MDASNAAATAPNVATTNVAAATAPNVADRLFTFGKHNGKTFQWVLENDHGYFDWAREKNAHGALRDFVEFGKRRELDAVAPLPSEDADIDTAAIALVKRSGVSVSVQDVEIANRKAMKRYKEDMADAKFQMTAKYSAWGYDSPGEFAANERDVMRFIAQAQPDLKEVELPSAQQLQEQEQQLQEQQKAHEDQPFEDLPWNVQVFLIAKAVIEVHRSANAKEQREFKGLDNDMRKQVHLMAESFPDLDVFTKDRTSAKNPGKKVRRGRGKSIAKMVITKKSAGAK